MDWEHLLSILDYQSRKWYEYREGKWHRIEIVDVFHILRDQGVDRIEQTKVMKQFGYRDQEAHHREHADIKRAQLAFGL